MANLLFVRPTVRFLKFLLKSPTNFQKKKKRTCIKKEKFKITHPKWIVEMAIRHP